MIDEESVKVFTHVFCN
jgi:NAD(P)-dependent dehydrogenase (short-subunit alcohol dehydrogenase family)